MLFRSVFFVTKELLGLFESDLTIVISIGLVKDSDNLILRSIYVLPEVFEFELMHIEVTIVGVISVCKGLPRSPLVSK